MPQFGKRSRDNLSTCHPDLQLLFNEVIKHIDCTILEGHRDEATQNRLFNEGKSKLKFPNGKHNSKPSNAVDVAPWPIDWNDSGRFYMFVGFVRAIAEQLKIPIRCGADWSGNWKTTDQTFHDLVHFELMEV